MVSGSLLCLKHIQELNKLFSRVQTKQAAGKAIKEMKDQLKQQATGMEDAHEELGNAQIKARLTDERR